MAKKTNTEINGNKYYRVTRTIGHKADGTPIKKQFYGSGINEANEKADLFMEKLKKGVITDKNKVFTINILLPKWLFTIKVNELKDTSLESYEGTFRNHVKPYPIANQDISSIRSIMIQDFYNNLSKSEVSIQNINKVHKLLNPFFKYCEKEGYISKNPCGNGLVTLPKNKDKDIDKIIKKQKIPFNYFTVDEIKLLREAFSNTVYKQVIDFALGTGMREGEIVGLKKTNIDFEKREIYVKNNTTRAAVFNTEGVKIGYETKDGTPKTESSIDIIPMSDFIYDLLKSLPNDPDSEYVFTVNGNQIDKKDLQKVWRKILLELCRNNENFEYRKFHDLRHTFAVLLLLNGIDLYTIMKLLRHKKLSSTEIYLAVLPESKEKSVNKISYIFEN